MGEPNYLVIKAKYEGNLRRFSARINDDHHLDLDISGLRTKIAGLFSFPADAEFTMRYIDEDDDIVTLVDDNDLRDVVWQDLKVLRIDVKLNNVKSGKPSSGSGGSSTPSRSPSDQSPVQTQVRGFDARVDDVLKSLPEPLRDALSETFSMLSFGVASKAASASPVVGDLVECLAKIGQTYLSTVSQSGLGANSSMPVGSSQSSSAPSAATDPNPSRDGGLRVVLPKTNAVNTSCETSNDANVGNAARGADVPAAVDLNVDPPADANHIGSATMTSGPSASNVFAPNDKKSTKESNGRNKGTSVSFDAYYGQNPSSECPCCGLPLGNPVPIPSFPYSPSKRSLGSTDRNPALTEGNVMFGKFHKGIQNPSNECPFCGLGNPVPIPSFPHSPSKRSLGSTDRNPALTDGNVMFGTFHKGIQCDGCGVLPITGPRFKSKVKDDYDLCSICFSKMGNDSDYIRMDRPVHRPWSFRASNDHIPRVGGPALPQILRNRVPKSSRKLDSRFILDVNVLDGTVLAPSTKFTKIWRMHNNGTLPWPRGTQLVWIGGYNHLSDVLAVDLMIPAADGLPVDGELDIAVDFTAPLLPGRYVSYWRMATQSGIKFGQHVWVLFHVDPSLKVVNDTPQGLNLNLPPESSGPRDSEIVDMNVDLVSELCNSNAVTGPVKPMVNELPTKEQILNNLPTSVPTSSSVSYPIVDQGFFVPVYRPPTSSSFESYPSIDPVVSAPACPHIPSSSVSYPIIDLSEEASSGPSQAPPPAICVQSSSPAVGTQAPAPAISLQDPTPATSVQAQSDEYNENDVEQTLLKELEEMGFNQVDLNKQILRMNEYDLEKSVDDLCGVAEWDPILEELQEMGFCDAETNRKLLKKNNGSIKGVVMDILSGGRA